MILGKCKDTMVTNFKDGEIVKEFVPQLKKVASNSAHTFHTKVYENELSDEISIGEGS